MDSLSAQQDLEADWNADREQSDSRERLIRGLRDARTAYPLRE